MDDSELELGFGQRQPPCFRFPHETWDPRVLFCSVERAVIAMECCDAVFSLFHEFLQDSVCRLHNNLAVIHSPLNLKFEALNPVL